MSPDFSKEARRHLLMAANAWRRHRGQLELREDWTAPPVGRQTEVAPSLGDGPIRIVVAPRRTGRPDAQIESKTIELLETDARSVLSRYEQAFGHVFNAD